MMKRHVLTLLLALVTLVSFGQSDGHIRYKEQGNTRFFGRTSIFRTDATNLDTLTSLHSGTLAFDTVKKHFVGYDQAEWQTLAFGQVQDTSVTIGTAAVLTLNSSPVTLVAAPGSGYAVEVITAAVKMTYNSAAYATNTTLEILPSGGSDNQVEVHTSFLTSTSDVFYSASRAGVTATNIIENAALVASVKTGDPTTGDSDITIYLRYRIIEL